MRVGSLFAGIGGFDLAFQRAGFDIAWHVEWDEACQRVLERRFHADAVGSAEAASPRSNGAGSDSASGQRPGPRSSDSEPLVFSDVRDCGAHNLPAVDVLVGGFPCQDVSVAGRRSGLAGERSGLWWEFHRIISELTPRWVVIENVPGLLSSNAGRDMGAILRSLGNLGYGWAYRILDAQWSGLAQRRKRVFIVGCLGDPARAAQVLLEPEGCPGNPPTRRAPGARASSSPEGRPPVARSLRATGNDSHAEDLDTYVTEQGGGVASTLQNSSGRRGHKVSAEDAAGNHLVIADPNLSHTRFAITSATHPSADASEDGTGRGTPIVTVQRRGRSDGSQDEVDESGVHPSLRAGDGGSSRDNLVAIPLDMRHASDSEHPTGVGTPGTGVGEDGRRSGPDSQTERRISVDIPTGPGVQVGMLVRRLTPLECERLQGFPDGWTEGQPDSTRYRQLGNAVAVPVVEWIARRIMEAEA